MNSTENDYEKLANQLLAVPDLIEACKIMYKELEEAHKFKFAYISPGQKKAIVAIAKADGTGGE